jgi:membrane fusion protein, heavy metal efflux system
MNARVAVCLAVCVVLSGCKKEFNPAVGAAPPAQVNESTNASVVTVDAPERFPVVAADRVDAPARLNVTGSVTPDIAREIPAISLASGRIVAIRARLDDNVKKGQLLFRCKARMLPTPSMPT